MKKALLIVLLVVAVVLAYALGRHSATKPVTASAARRVLYWVDPMHPDYKSDKPGIAPDCGMQLQPVYADTLASSVAADNSMAEMPAGTVNIDSEKQQLVGITLATVERTTGTRSLRVPGRVEPDETRVFRLNAGTDGFVRETFQDAAGTEVKKDQRLASFYAPEFLTVAGGYISTTERGPSTAIQSSILGTQNWADRLRNLGMSDAQIKELGTTRKIPDTVYIVAPVDGFILARNISPGMKFDRGMEFYRVADLSKVWVTANVFENEVGYLRPGMAASVQLPDGERSIAARVSQVLPQIDAASRTVQVRLEVDNPGFRLRPDMYVDVELPVKLPAGLSVPVDAVLDSGLNQRVFVDRGNGTFEPRAVQTGWRFGDRIEIAKGLAAGERVVASGTFLVDSESRLKTAATMPQESNMPHETAGRMRNMLAQQPPPKLARSGDAARSGAPE